MAVLSRFGVSCQELPERALYVRKNLLLAAQACRSIVRVHDGLEDMSLDISWKMRDCRRSIHIIQREGVSSPSRHGHEPTAIRYGQIAAFVRPDFLFDSSHSRERQTKTAFWFYPPPPYVLSATP